MIEASFEFIVHSGLFHIHVLVNAYTWLCLSAREHCNKMQGDGYSGGFKRKCGVFVISVSLTYLTFLVWCSFHALTMSKLPPSKEGGFV